MGDKNSYFPSFGGCQAISEIKQVGSSDDTIAPVPRQAFSKHDMWVYTDTLTSVHTRSCLFLMCLVYRTHFSLGRASVTVTGSLALEIKLSLEHISDTVHLWKAEQRRAGSSFDKELPHGSVWKSPDEFWRRAHPQEVLKAGRPFLSTIIYSFSRPSAYFSRLTICHFFPCSLHGSLHVIDPLSHCTFLPLGLRTFLFHLESLSSTLFSFSSS